MIREWEINLDNISSNTLYKKKEDLKTNINLLRVRKKQKSKKPHFIREESWRYKRLGDTWRRPKGIDSKMRFKKKSGPRSVGVGYRSPKKIRGFHPSGFEEKHVHNIKDLEKIGPKQVVRLAHTIGRKKRLQIIDKARELRIHILNTRGVSIDEPKKSKKISI